MNDFLKELYEAERIRSELLTKLDDRDRLREQGSSVTQLESNIRGELRNLATRVNHLSEEVEEFQVNHSKYRVNLSELTETQAKVNALEEDLYSIDTRFKKNKEIIPSGTVGVNFKRAGDGENLETRNLANKDLAQSQMQMLKNQEKLEEAIVGTTENLVVVARNIGDELDLQNHLLDGVDKQVGSTTRNIKKTTFRMKELIRKSADGCMLCCIVLLIIVLVCLIVLL